MSEIDVLDSDKKHLIKQFLDTGCLKFGQFTLKTGIQSDHYVNLREISMYPSIFKTLVASIRKILVSRVAETKSKIAIVGVPYGVVPLASVVAYDLELPYYPVRKETKAYGLKPDESSFNDHEFIMVEDVMSTGSSIIETIQKMEGKNITDILVVVNRELGGDENLKNSYPNIKLHSILKSSEILKSNRD